MNSHNFGKDYYENGVKTKTSGYENYRWIPTRSIPEAIDICKKFDFHTCLDYGCAKGFLVHALRLLGKQAYGFDFSEYAIQTCLPQVKNYVTSKPFVNTVDLLICKDVLEHVEEKDIPSTLESFKRISSNFFFVIPLGDNNSFRIREYEIDITHVTKKDEEWWLNMFESNGFKLKEFSYSLGSVKEKWIAQDPYGNGFFHLELQ